MAHFMAIGLWLGLGLSFFNFFLFCPFPNFVLLFEIKYGNPKLNLSILALLCLTIFVLSQPFYFFWVTLIIKFSLTKIYQITRLYRC